MQHHALTMRTRLAWLAGKLGMNHPPGRAGERVAEKFLKKQGYRILGRNIKLALGEIDLVAESLDERTIVIVEVKTTVDNNAPNPRPEVHVNRHKQRKLATLAAELVKRHRLHDRPVRFDVIGVDLVRGAQPRVRHHIAAFESYF